MQGRGSISKLAQSLRCHYPHLNAIKLGLGSAVAVEEENDEDEVFDEATVISLIQTAARLVRIEMMMDNFTNKICKALLTLSAVILLAAYSAVRSRSRIPMRGVPPRHPNGDSEFIEDTASRGWEFVDDPIISPDFIIINL
ncbi:hypothetical protein CPC16_003778 [Podila verticillata]|nr:hypothetical protein CPC16_003778 [Podila verticillata]